MTEEYEDNFDRLWNEEQDFREMEKWNQKVQRYQARKNQQATQELQNQMFKKALDKHGLTPEEFQQLAQMDPQFYNKAYEDGLENLVRTVKTRARDPKTGQFISQAQARKQGVAPQVDPHEAHYRAANEQSRIEKLKEKGRKEGLSKDSDIETLLDAALGKLFD